MGISVRAEKEVPEGMGPIRSEEKGRGRGGGRGGKSWLEKNTGDEPRGREKLVIRSKPQDHIAKSDLTLLGN